MANPTQYGNFVPTSNVWDVSQVNALERESPQLKELLVRLYQNLNMMSLSLNSRDAGFYDLQEFVNGQLWFPNPANTGATSARPDYRQDFRKVFNILTPTGIPSATTLTINHGITVTDKTTFTRIYGVAQDQTNDIYRPLPYVNPLDNNISLYVTNTQIVIQSTSLPYSTINLIYVVLEYLQS